MKKKLLSLILILFLSVSVFLTGCKEVVLEDNPATGANVISNGGMSVVKGDYLYFVNGYVDETSLSDKDNKMGEVEKSAIYRTKLVNGEIVKDKDGFVEKTERVVSKVVGFSNGGFYIIDDYIYYATPYMNYNQSGVLQTSRVEFHRININGSEKSDTKLYTTSVSEQNLDWTMYKVNGTVYLLTYCDGKIISVNASNGNVVAEIANSSSYAFAYETNYSTSKSRDSELAKYVYFTRAVEPADNAGVNVKGNVICKFDVTNGEVKPLNVIDDYTYTITGTLGDSLYYTKANSKYNGEAILYRKPVSDSWSKVSEIEMSAGAAYTNYYLCPFGDNMVIATDDNGTYVIEAGIRTVLSSTKYNILGIYGSYVYYTSGEENTTLARFNLNDRNSLSGGQITTENASTSDKSQKLDNKNFIDFDNQRVYVFAEYTAENSDKNYYLNYINETTRDERFVGKFESNDIPS